jgi:hypothetical protein
MLFLPGTYFAALWAIPSLKWGQPNVIQPDFYWYWAFTLPSTLFIFAVWFGLHKWGFHRPQSLKPGKDNTGYEVLDGGPPPPLPPPTVPMGGYYTPPAGTIPQVKYNSAPTSAPPMMDFGNYEAQGYSAPPMIPTDTYAQPYSGQIPAMDAYAVPSNTDVRDYGRRPNPQTSAPAGY